MRRSPEGFYSGRELETDVFGNFKKSKEFMQAYRAVAAESGYVPYGQAMELVRKYGDSDPTNPDKEFANDLRIEIADQLDLASEEEESLHFYSAVGTPIDHFHGVDAWVEYVDAKSGERISLTLDVTKRDTKVSEGHKADFIISDVPAPEDDGYLDFVTEYGKEIAGQLSQRIERARQGSVVHAPVNRAPRRRRAVDPSELAAK